MNTSIVAPFFRTRCTMQDTVIFYGKTTNFIMAALWNTAGHYIFALWFLLSFFLSVYLSCTSCLQCFDTVGCAAERASSL